MMDWSVSDVYLFNHPSISMQTNTETFYSITLYFMIFFSFEGDLCISFIHSDIHICTFPTQKGHWKHIVNTDESDL